MIKITNLTNSPYDLASVGGKVRLPAFGSVEGEFSGEYLHILRNSGAVRIEAGEPVEQPKAQEKGADQADPVDKLRAEYKELAGNDADKRWGEARLQSEIDKLLKA